MATITNKQIDNLLYIAGNLCALEDALQIAINSKNLENVELIRRHLAIVRERLMSTINDIDR